LLQIYSLTSPRKLMGGTSFILFFCFSLSFFFFLFFFFFGLAWVFKLYLKARLRANYGPRKEPTKGLGL